jgi:hypothetical protein
MPVTTFTEREILGQLDEHALLFDFPMLDMAYNALAGMKLHAFGDELRWAIVIEHLAYDTQTGGHEGMTNNITWFGNCLLKATNKTHDFLVVTADEPGERTFEDHANWYLLKPTGQLRIRDELVVFDCTRETLEQTGIPLNEAQASGEQLLRSLLPKYQHHFFARESELRKNLPFDLPCLLSLSEWNHPDISGQELPSGHETFQLIAKTLCSRDPSSYSPTLPPNTHWSNWPDGGNL